LPQYIDRIQTADNSIDRLSEVERQVVQTIAIQDRSISLSELIGSSQIAPSDLLEALQSLGRRRLIDKQQTEIGVLFDLQPILKEFILCIAQSNYPNST
jgi:DNA-binding MarR family transcriptional regulator